MPDREKVIKGLELCTAISQDGCLMLCPYKDEQDETYSGFCEQVLKRDALALLKEQQTEIDKLKEPGKLINADKLREKLGFAESCEKCKKDSWVCQRDMYFSEMDFCTRLDIAIEELIQEGR